MPDFYTEIIEILKDKNLEKDKLAKLKIDLSRKYHTKKISTDLDILLHAKPEDLPKLHILTKPTRSISGVAVVALMSAPIACRHGRCIFCPGGPGSIFGDTPQSYTGKEPSTMRGIRAQFDPYVQIFNRLEQYVATGHDADKVDVIIQGGTFPSFDFEYQEQFCAYIFKALNDFSDMFFPAGAIDVMKYREFFELPGNIKDNDRMKRVREKILALKGTAELEKEQLRNEKTKARCIGLTIETKPDYGKLREGNMMLAFGCTRVEVGVQTVYDDVLQKTNRGHTLKDTVESIRELKDLGFKINAHYMLGLPGVTRKMEIDGLKELFDNPDYRPDMLKIYPCLVIPGTPLYELWKKEKYAQMTTPEAAEIISEAKRFIPEYVRIMRVQRDIPTYVTVAGVDKTNLRQYVEKRAIEKGIVCRCVRCRESGRKKAENPEIVVREYDASGGKEFFISVEDVKNDSLFGLLRLRFPSESLRSEITPTTSIVREIHVYSKALTVGGKSETSIQHKGFGKQLMEKAEKISLQHGKNKVLVIAGIGAREYFRKLGYERYGPYMRKQIEK